MAPGILAVLADPVSRSDDPRLREPPNATAAGEGAPVDIERSAGDPDGFRRLPHTRQEAEALLAMVPADKSLRALGLAASRELATSGRLARYRMIHLATHGLLHAQHPELSGIVLSLVDADRRPVDGFLRAHEIYTLELPAELVVLSACRTALGKAVRGEGSTTEETRDERRDAEPRIGDLRRAGDSAGRGRQERQAGDARRGS